MAHRLLWATDIHLNFADRTARAAFLDAARAHRPDGLVLSGDIAEAPTVVRCLKLLEMTIDAPVYFVLGNHDFYRGSMAGVRAAVRDLVREAPRLHWLNDAGVLSLTDETALIGHDAWADGRFGDFYASRIELNDFHHIEELTTTDKAARLAQMQALADEAAAHFRAVLPQALENHRHVIVATHVPPFREACRRNGHIWSADWLPFFTCKAVGEVLKEAMLRHPHHHLTVLCGHIHSANEVDILPNLKIFTGAAEYRAPKPQKLLEIA